MSRPIIPARFKEIAKEAAQTKKERKTGKRGRPKLTPKQRAFARKYVELGNKTEAYAQAYDVTTENRQSISRMSVETSQLPHVNREIERLFAAQGLEMVDVLSIHSRNLHQDKHLPTSQKAVTDYYELVGLKKNADTPTVNVAFIIKRNE